MESTPHKPFSAAVAAGCVFGVLAGIGGFVHGIGEILQGSVKTDGLWIESWNSGPIYEYMGGEPGISIVPNYLISGILTVIAAILIIVFAIAFVQRKNWGWLIIGASVAMLLTGGGIGPPVIGILGGTCALGINTDAKGKPSGRLRSALSAIWPYLFAVTALAVVFVVVGSFLLVYLISFNNPDLFSNSFLASVLLLGALNFSCRAYDAKRREEHSG